MKKIQWISLFFLLAASGTGRATQTFDMPVVHELPFDPHAMTTGDVTGDELDDVIVAAKRWDAGLGLWLFKGASGGLASAEQLPYPNSSAYTQVLRTADFNGSGTNQILLVDAAGRLYLISYGHRTRTVRIPDATATNADIGDFNGDGSPDLVIADPDAGGYVLLNDGHGGFANQLSFALPPFAQASTAVGDLNDDGRPDYVLTMELNAYVYLNQGGGAFGTPIVIEPGYDISSASVGDFNNDGLDDLVLAQAGNSPVVIKIYRQSAGTLVYAGSMPTYDIPDANAVADADGDGDDDLALIHVGWGAIGIYRSSSDGLSAEELHGLPWVSWESDIRISDVTGDGCRDLVVSVAYELAVFAGKGCTPAFDLRLTSATGPQAVSLVAENLGIADAAENVSMVATLATRTGLLDVNDLPAGCVPTQVAAKSATVRCEVASIPASETATWLIPYSVVPTDTPHRIDLSATINTDTPEQTLLNNSVWRNWLTSPVEAKAKALKAKRFAPLSRRTRVQKEGRIPSRPAQR
jgi:hypothetical protein